MFAEILRQVIITPCSHIMYFSLRVDNIYHTVHEMVNFELEENLEILNMCLSSAFKEKYCRYM